MAFPTTPEQQTAADVCGYADDVHQLHSIAVRISFHQASLFFFVSMQYAHTPFIYKSSRRGEALSTTPDRLRDLRSVPHSYIYDFNITTTFFWRWRGKVINHETALDKRCGFLTNTRLTSVSFPDNYTLSRIVPYTTGNQHTVLRMPPILIHSVDYLLDVGHFFRIIHLPQGT